MGTLVPLRSDQQVTCPTTCIGIYIYIYSLLPSNIGHSTVPGLMKHDFADPNTDDATDYASASIVEVTRSL